MEQMKMSLKMLRQARGLTQVKAAREIGISVDTLSKYEKGRSYPDISILQRIETVYKTTYDRIIFLPLDYDLNVKRQKRNEGYKLAKVNVFQKKEGVKGQKN